MQKIKFSLGIIIAVIGCVLFVFFQNYEGTIIPYPILILVVSLIFIFIGLAIIVKSLTSPSWGKQQQRELEYFKQHADKLLVDLSKCSIKKSNYTEIIESPKPYQVAMYDAIYDNNRDIETQTINQSVICFDWEKNGKTQTFYSPVIYMDSVTLHFLLLKQKFTYLYVSRNEEETHCYFDLDFLDEQ